MARWKIVKSARAYLLVVSVIAVGCQTIDVPVPSDAVPVQRQVNFRKWKNFAPEESITFGSYNIVNPKRSGTRSDSRRAIVSTDRLQRSRVREEASSDFQLRQGGQVIAGVTARGRRKGGRLSTKIGNFDSTDFDRLEGTITLASGQLASFRIDDFHSERSSAVASGEVMLADERVRIQEIESGVMNNVAGFAGVRFYWNGQKAAEVCVGQKEHFWIEDAIPEELAIAIAATAATCLIADRI